MKIKAIDSRVKSMKLIVPFDGMITIDANGYADVSDKCAEELVKKTGGWIYANGVNKPFEDKAKTEGEKAAGEQKKGEKPEDVNEPESEEEEGEELTAESLNTMTVKELRELCKESGFDEGEYKDLKKSELIKYILSKVEE